MDVTNKIDGWHDAREWLLQNYSEYHTTTEICAAMDDQISVVASQPVAVSAASDEMVRAQAEAWFSVFEALQQAMPEWIIGKGTGEQKAVAAIHTLAARAAAPVNGPLILGNNITLTGQPDGSMKVDAAPVSAQPQAAMPNAETVHCIICDMDISGSPAAAEECHRAAPSPQPVADSEGLRQAADYIDRKAESYLQNHTRADYDTGATEWRNEKCRDRYYAMTELADEMRNLTPAAALQPVAGLTDDKLAQEVRDWFPDRAGQAEHFARAVMAGEPHWTKRQIKGKAK